MVKTTSFTREVAFKINESVKKSKTAKLKQMTNDNAVLEYHQFFS